MLIIDRIHKDIKLKKPHWWKPSETCPIQSNMNRIKKGMLEGLEKAMFEAEEYHNIWDDSVKSYETK